MTKISAPMTQDLMVRYGVVRWTMVRPFRLVLSLFLRLPILWISGVTPSC